MEKRLRLQESLFFNHRLNVRKGAYELRAPRDQLLQPMRRPVRRGLIAAGGGHQAVASTLEGILTVVGVVDHLLQHAEDCRGGGEVGFCDQNTGCLE